MKKQLATLLIVFLVLLTACNKSASHEHDDEHEAADSAAVSYTCTMHPTVTADKPGNCSMCGMALVKQVEGGEEEHSHSADTTSH